MTADVQQPGNMRVADVPGGTDPAKAVAEFIAEYDDPQKAAAWFLCDRHDPSKIAYRIVRTDLSARDLSYGELREDSERFAAALSAMGLGPGDRIATLMGKSRDYLVALVAIWRLGAVHVPLFTAFAPAAIEFRLRGSGARAVICDSAQHKKLLASEDLPGGVTCAVISTGDCDQGAFSFRDLISGSRTKCPAAAFGGDGALIHIYTSGTTGSPKGVVFPQRALASVRAYATFGLDLRADDLFWCAADPGWAYGLYFGILATLSTGVESLLVEGGFSPEAAFSILSRYGVTNFAAAPTVYRAMRALKSASRAKLRCASSAGEPLSPEINDWAEPVFGVQIHDHYGQTEAGMLINNHHHPSLAEVLVPGSMGRALPGWTAGVLDLERDVPASSGQVGRLAMDLTQSPLAWFVGYAGDAGRSREKFSSDGRWYLTGDLARQDQDGRFHFSSRDDDVILMAGYRIGPAEVETAINSHPHVLESAVIAVPDEIRGEVVEAFVVVAPGASESDELAGEIQQWVKTRYAAHAYPRKVHFVANLPKTPSGKLQRYLLRAQSLSRATL